MPILIMDLMTMAKAEHAKTLFLNAVNMTIKKRRNLTFQHLQRPLFIPFCP